MTELQAVAVQGKERAAYRERCHAWSCLFPQ